MDPQASDPKRGQPPTGPDDAQLVEQTLAGKRQAFDELIRKYQRQAVAVSYRLLGNSHDALEVTQDAFLKAFASLDTLQKPGAFGGWLMRIVSNLSLNYRRSRKTRQSVPLAEVLGPQGGESTEAHGGGSEWMASSADPVRGLEGRELGEKLKQALAQLPEKQRLALIMFTIDEMPQKQVAEALECSVEAVKWHVFQGRKKLKELLKEVMQMISEELEFRISQYADGTLPAEEVAALEAMLANDADARAMLESYRTLDATLKRELPLPAMDFDRLHRHLSDAVAERDRSMVTIKLFTWTRAAGVAVAAMVMIAVGTIMFRSSKPAVIEEVAIVNPVTVTSTPVVNVSGPAVEVASAPVEEVSIGPSQIAQRQPLNYAASEDLIYRAPRVVIASTYVKRQDTPSILPF